MAIHDVCSSLTGRAVFARAAPTAVLTSWLRGLGGPPVKSRRHLEQKVRELVRGHSDVVS
jgi:hypothetical protein